MNVAYDPVGLAGQVVPELKAAYARSISQLATPEPPVSVPWLKVSVCVTCVLGPVGCVIVTPLGPVPSSATLKVVALEARPAPFVAVTLCDEWAVAVVLSE